MSTIKDRDDFLLYMENYYKSAKFENKENTLNLSNLMKEYNEKYPDWIYPFEIDHNSDSMQLKKYIDSFILSKPKDIPEDLILEFNSKFQLTKEEKENYIRSQCIHNLLGTCSILSEYLSSCETPEAFKKYLNFILEMFALARSWVRV